MVVFDGFWTGAVFGFLFALAFVLFLSIRLEFKRQKDREVYTKILKSLNDDAKEKVNEINN